MIEMCKIIDANMTDTIKFLISKNDEFSECIERMAAKLEIENDNKREMILVGFFNNTRVHFINFSIFKKHIYISTFYNTFKKYPN